MSASNLTGRGGGGRREGRRGEEKEEKRPCFALRSQSVPHKLLGAADHRKCQDEKFRHLWLGHEHFAPSRIKKSHRETALLAGSDDNTWIVYGATLPGVRGRKVGLNVQRAITGKEEGGKQT